MARPNVSIFDPPNTGPVYTRELEEKYYELTDHLGNVRAVISDRKLSHDPGVGEYYADVVAYSHSYPFGMPQPGRTWDNSVGYRYGFNGMETDPEVKGDPGNHYTTYFRQYDPRVARWWSGDPVVQAGESPYAAMYNNPIFFSDPFGDDPPGGGGGEKRQGTGDGYRWQRGYDAEGNEIIVVTHDDGSRTYFRRAATEEERRVAPDGWIAYDSEGPGATVTKFRAMTAEVRRELADLRDQRERAANRSRAIEEFHRAVSAWDERQYQAIENVKTGSPFVDWFVKAAVLRPILVLSQTGSGGDFGRALASAKEWDGLPGLSFLHSIGKVSEEGLNWGNGLGLVLSATDFIPGGGAADNAVVAGIGWVRRYGDDALEGAGDAARGVRNLVGETGEQAAKKADDVVESITIRSIVKQDEKLHKLAQQTFKGNNELSDEANRLISQLSQGNMNPGRGTKNIFGNIFEARGRQGARVYFRNVDSGIEIVGYSSKANQEQVISRLTTLYGG